MKSNFWLLGGIAWLATATVWAQETSREGAPTNSTRRLSGVAKDVVLPSPATGTVKNDSLNVRSEPNWNSDLLTHLHHGQSVTVFEQITLAKPKPNEPTNWARIALPTNAAVWVAAQYIDTNTMTVSRRVNVRGGPSDVFTVVSRLEKGAPVVVVAHRPDWLQIMPPTNAFGYVAAEYLTMEPVTAPPATTVAADASTPAAATPAAATTMAAAPTNTVAETTNTTPAPTPATTVATVPPETAATNVVSTNTTPVADVSTPITAPEPAVTVPPTTPITPTNTVTPAAATPVATTPAATTPTSPATSATPDNTDTETKPRVITREGYVRKALNIQAPADYELHDVNSGDVIEYVQPDPKDKNFKKYVGTRVLISGTEWLDKRWPKRPILKVETVDLLP